MGVLQLMQQCIEELEKMQMLTKNREEERENQSGHGSGGRRVHIYGIRKDGELASAEVNYDYVDDLHPVSHTTLTIPRQCERQSLPSLSCILWETLPAWCLETDEIVGYPSFERPCKAFEQNIRMDQVRASGRCSVIQC